MVYDVIVVGAGPAGAVVAALLSQQHLKVLLLERSALPRYKPCGGGLTVKAARALPFKFNSTLDVIPSGGILSFAGNELLRTRFTKPIGSLVMRDRFDMSLVEIARKSGTKIAEQVTFFDYQQDEFCLTVRTNLGELQTHFIVGADGVNSRVARSAGLLSKRKTGIAIEAELDVPPFALDAQDSYATFDFGATKFGYGWIFPKGDHFSAGIFSTRTSARVLDARALEKFIKSHAVLGESRIRLWRGHRIPLGGSSEPLAKGRILLVGDAANLADPWLGEGLYYAIVSARVAADNIIRAMESGQELVEYSKQIHAAFNKQFRIASQFASIVYSLPRLASSLLSGSSFLQESLFNTLRGDSGYSELRRKIVHHLPRIIGEVLTSDLN